MKNKENIKQISARVRLPWASPPELGPRQSRAGHSAAHIHGWWEFSPTSPSERAPHRFIYPAATPLPSSYHMQAVHCLTLVPSAPWGLLAAEIFCTTGLHPGPCTAGFLVVCKPWSMNSPALVGGHFFWHIAMCIDLQITH